MPVSKPDYIGLDDLPARISKNNPPKDDLVKYFICLCAGKTEGNGAIANKAEITPIRGEMFGSWLYVAKLISEDGKLTEYGMQELELLRAQKKDYVAGLLGEDMLDERNYFLGIESSGNSALHKEPDNVPVATIPEKQEFVVNVPVSGYVEQKEHFEDILNAGGEPPGHELLDNEPKFKKNRNKVEIYKLEILEKIKMGITDYHTIAETMGIEPSYASLLMSHLKKCGCTKGRGKDRIITDKGISDLNSNKIDKPKISSKTTGEENKMESNETDRYQQPINSDMLRQASSELPINPTGTEATVDNLETLKYEVLKQIYRGVINNYIIAKNVGGNISEHDVSSIVGMLRTEGCVERYQSKRRITSIGIEMLNPRKAGYDDVPAMIEPERQFSEVKSPAEIEPVQTQELKPFPPLSYHGLAGKKPSDETRNKAFGQKQVDKYINARWYANMPKSEGRYAKSREKIESPSEELLKRAILIEEIPAELPKEAVASVNVVDISEIITGHTEPIEHEESDLRLLAFLLGCESTLMQEEMSLLFEEYGGVYRFESGIKRNNFFSKANGVYKLNGSGVRKLESLEQDCHSVVPKYLDIINYLHVNKRMPPKAEQEPVFSAGVDETALKSAVEKQEPQEALLASVPVPVQQEEYMVPEPEAEKKPEKETPVEEKTPEGKPILLLYSEPLENNSVPVPEIARVKLDDYGALAESIGMHKKGERYIIPVNDGQRTIVANKRFQEIGRLYLDILQGDKNNAEKDHSLYTELNILNWIVGDNGDMKVTNKGEDAILVLNWLRESFTGAA